MSPSCRLWEQKKADHMVAMVASSFIERDRAQRFSPLLIGLP